MSYAFKVTKSDSGLSITCDAVHNIPDGAMFIVNGHEDPSGQNINVTRANAIGQTLLMASAAVMVPTAPEGAGQ